jgi:hypothetical protein
MNRLASLRKAALLTGLLVGLCPAAMGADQVGGQIGSLGVTAVIEPYMSVSIVTVPWDPTSTGQWGKTPSTDAQDMRSLLTSSEAPAAIEFAALEKPAVVDGDKYVLISVSSNCTSWSVTCSSEGLVSSDDAIPPDRLFVRSAYTNPGVDNGAGAGFEGLSAPRVVATGSVAQEVIHQAMFKLNVTWEDRPGSYDGVLTFTVLPTP